MVKQNLLKKALSLAALTALAAGSGGCMFGPSGDAVSPQSGVTINGSGQSGGGGSAGAPGSAGSSGGGTQSSSVANVNNAFFRIQNALTLPQPSPSATPNAPLVSYLAKNFMKAAAQQTANLSATSNPTTASGVSSIPLLAFAACTDVSPSSYSVTGTLTGAPTTAQSSAIVAAGLTIVNQCTAGLAAAGSGLGTQVTAVFNSQLAAVPSGTTASQAFVAVCTAATSFCVSMTGY